MAKRAGRILKIERSAQQNVRYDLRAPPAGRPTIDHGHMSIQRKSVGTPIRPILFANLNHYPPRARACVCARRTICAKTVPIL